MLEFFNNKFINSSIKIKIELYILPLLITSFIYFFFLTNDEKKFETPLKENMVSYQKKSFDGSFDELFLILEKLAIKNNLLISSNSRKEKLIFLKGEGDKKAILDFIKEIEYINGFTKIDTLILNKKTDNKKFLFDLKIDLNNFYRKNLQENESKNIEKKEFKINAIISDFALINETWLKKDENIDNFKLVKIENNFVLLKSENQEIKLELHDKNYNEKFD